MTALGGVHFHIKSKALEAFCCLVDDQNYANEQPQNAAFWGPNVWYRYWRDCYPRLVCTDSKPVCKSPWWQVYHTTLAPPLHTSLVPPLHTSMSCSMYRYLHFYASHHVLLWTIFISPCHNTPCLMQRKEIIGLPRSFGASITEHYMVNSNKTFF